MAKAPKSKTMTVSCQCNFKFLDPDLHSECRPLSWLSLTILILKKVNIKIFKTVFLSFLILKITKFNQKQVKIVKNKNNKYRPKLNMIRK